MEYAEINIKWDPEDTTAYEAQFNGVRFQQAIAVLKDLLDKMIEEVKVGQTEHPQLAVTPIPGGNDDVLN